MSYQVLARKWRPKLFKEVIGQQHITRTLKNSVINNKIAHAYLLTGTRGVGKTTIARIFAKAIRCENKSPDGEPCLTCDPCIEVDKSHSIDYIEIDGASNNSVEDVRDLIDNVQYLPTNGKYKVYVVDEVHMLTVNAFNALLKTLEEPPEHVVFIFATTDPQKLLGTVLSRCQRLDFKHVSVEVLKNHLIEITNKEEIKLESPRIAELIAKYARGSVRDSLSLLDQVISLCFGGVITELEMSQALGLVSDSSLIEITTAVITKQKQQASKSFQSALEQNMDLKVFVQQILEEIFNLINNIDEQGEIVTDKYSEKIFENISLVELAWLFETLAKDFEWALKSTQPEQSVAFALVKSTLRDEILGPIKTQISVKKKLTEPVVESAPDLMPALKPVPKTERSWRSFLTYLQDENRALSVNLERGNIIDESFLTASSKAVAQINFEESAKIFYDYLIDPENRAKLQSILANYLENPEVEVSFNILTEQDCENKNFKSSVEIEVQELEEVEENRRTKILDSKYIKEAEKIFNKKVDKVILNKG